MNTDTKIVGGIVVVTLVILVGGVFLASRQPSQETSVPEDQVISRNGLHWHPKLSIYLKGNEQEIPKDIGIGAIHQPIHTHDTSGALHMEMKGLVTKDETRLGNFFRTWGKDFNSNCIFDYCNGSDGLVKMIVNGQESKEFENYLMKDGYKIEIRYE